MENKPSLPATKPEKDTLQEKPPKSGHHGLLAAGAIAVSLVNDNKVNHDTDKLAPKIDIMSKDSETAQMPDSTPAQQN